MESDRAKVRFFEERAADWEEACYPRDVRARLEELIPSFGIRPGETVLDVGTGPGVLMPYIQKVQGPVGRLVAFDLAWAMAKEAARKPRRPRDGVLRADVHALPFPDGLFDRVLCFAAFPHFADPAAAVKEMHRVLRRGGVLVIAHLLSREELARHHASHGEVRRDVLPPEPAMRALLGRTGFLVVELVDRPGRYLARAVKTGRPGSAAMNGHFLRGHG
ncbi:Methyltransferase domain-containing protein [Desulfacinum infernum DSM 9756]|uniref:Methyltransferase domain-containing protein n=1 Tax=Desulfacinum infernum DSM 9756 TaxID=1121391 RepID=A0A1M4ZHC9_9BACT|nr:class I SAM-dependent methyltransferase [Desulfacinum infernum]SHF17202.1 Methyltransferase domain-containing protein [Desulfacinum infernum DSM 9756]